MIGASEGGETANSKKSKNEVLKPVIARNATDVQRIRLDKLMKHLDKPVVIPEKPKDKNSPHVPEFVRNVMGSSAGAGSGEFHVYRHLRRKEYARQKCIQEKAEKELLEDDYHYKLEENKRNAEERTAKKRAKRLKKKKKLKGKKPKMAGNTQDSSESSSEPEDDEIQEEDQEKSELDGVGAAGQRRGPEGGQQKHDKPEV